MTGRLGGGVGHGEEAGDEGCECGEGRRGEGERDDGAGFCAIGGCRCILSRSEGRDCENAMDGEESAWLA